MINDINAELDRMLIPRANRLFYIFFSCLFFSFKISFLKSKVFFLSFISTFLVLSLLFSFAYTPASTPLFARPSLLFKINSCLPIACDFARFFVQYLSHLNLISFFSIQKMGFYLLTLLQ